MARTFRTIAQSIAAPVLSTSLYFIVFGTAIGSRMGTIDSISYGAFIIPGLVMLSLLSESISNASFGIYMPKWAEHYLRIIIGAGVLDRSINWLCWRRRQQIHYAGFIDLNYGTYFCTLRNTPPGLGTGILVLTAVTFSLFGFIIGLWADNFQKLQVIPY